ncbi:MAG: hypothetical protein QNJ22_18435 [Desulfosarcinaceae bacterium]|nr:hypothetical protein [Desulfosarcinaceae bacterium]
MDGKQMLLLGATGMVGGIALRLGLEHPQISKVTVIGRRPTGVVHPKLQEMHHADYGDFSAIVEGFAYQDLALYCLGVYTGAVPDEAFRKLTVDTTIAFGRILHQKSPAATVCFLSGQGADSSEKSRVAFARYKGMAENALLSLGFPRVHIFRPGYIYPVTKRKEPNMMYTVSRWLYPLMRRIYPNIGISSEDLARVMVAVGIGGRDNPNPVLENRAIRAEVRP